MWIRVVKAVVKVVVKVVVTPNGLLARSLFTYLHDIISIIVGPTVADKIS